MKLFYRKFALKHEYGSVLYRIKPKWFTLTGLLMREGKDDFLDLIVVCENGIYINRPFGRVFFILWQDVKEVEFRALSEQQWDYFRPNVLFVFNKATLKDRYCFHAKPLDMPESEFFQILKHEFERFKGRKEI